MKLRLILFCAVLSSCVNQGKKSAGEEWIQLFNGKNLDGWEIKFRGHELNDNYKNTFRAENGLLRVCYDEYTEFKNEFGHIFYKTPFSEYKIRVEYRFIGEQTKGGPSWAFRNNGIMFHSQSAMSMLKDQDFPVSIEAQLLGGDGASERPTMNVCTPGTNIVMDSKLVTQHCTESKSKTFNGDVWVTAELVVYGDSLIYHIVNGDTVLTYSKPQIGGDLPAGFPLAEGTLLKEGYIALQAESGPCEFRKIELLNLKGKR
jgi:hypothetical protein